MELAVLWVGDTVEKGIAISNAEFELLVHFGTVGDQGLSVQAACERSLLLTGVPPRRPTVYALFYSLRDKGMVVELPIRPAHTSGRPPRLFAATPLGFSALHLYERVQAWRVSRFDGEAAITTGPWPIDVEEAPVLEK